MRNHPDIEKIERTGYIKEPEIVGQDHFNNDIYIGDTVYELNDSKFTAEELTPQEIEILEVAMADKYTA